jgi:hypothetical protein
MIGSLDDSKQLLLGFEDFLHIGKRLFKLAIFYDNLPFLG